MQNFSLDKYKYYINGNTVIAVSTYAGRTVKGYAKCDPRDEYDLEYGKALAAARCNEKIAEKRFNRACTKLNDAKVLVQAANDHLHEMDSYYEDALGAIGDARIRVNELLKQKS